MVSKILKNLKDINSKRKWLEGAIRSNHAALYHLEKFQKQGLKEVPEDKREFIDSLEAITKRCKENYESIII